MTTLWYQGTKRDGRSWWLKISLLVRCHFLGKACLLQCLVCTKTRSSTTIIKDLKSTMRSQAPSNVLQLTLPLTKYSFIWKRHLLTIHLIHHTFRSNASNRIHLIRDIYQYSFTMHPEWSLLQHLKTKFMTIHLKI